MFRALLRLFLRVDASRAARRPIRTQLFTPYSDDHFRGWTGPVRQISKARPLSGFPTAGSSPARAPKCL